MNLNAFYILNTMVLKASRFTEVSNLGEPRCILHSKNNGLEASRVEETRDFIILKGGSRRTSMTSMASVQPPRV